jgi:uncharacterized protein
MPRRSGVAVGARFSAIGLGALASLAEGSLMKESEHPISAILPNTKYYEIESKLAAATFGIWVTTPPRYEAEPERKFAPVYLTDGNLAAPSFAPRSVMLTSDPIAPIEPIIQIAIGYCGAEAHDVLRRRNRDLLPPGEPVNPSFDAAIDDFVAKGVMTVEQADDYKRSIRDTRADLFLAFLTEELHPQLAAVYRFDDSKAGLFGASYGGLFALWVALQRTTLFKKIGAHSPGMLVDNSCVFKLLKQEQDADADHAGRQLHMTVCEREITFPSFYQMLGRNFALFMELIGGGPLRNLELTARIIPDESHATSTSAGWSSFLRTCYPSRGR